MTDIFPPFAPEGDEAKKKHFRPIPIRVIVPNMITLMSLCLGLTAIRFAFDERWSVAVYSILGAALLDGLDGRVARLLKGTSRFGAELDSLADFVCFGVAPALLLYSFSLSQLQLKSIGWLVVLIFAMAMALRLARFNVLIDAPDRADWQKNFFVGVPAPAGAMLSMLPLYLFFLFETPLGPSAPILVMFYTLAIAFLTICTLPVYSGKNLGLKISRGMVLPLFLVLVAGVGLVVSFPFTMMTLITVGYLVSIPFGVIRYRQLELAESLKAKSEQSEALRNEEHGNA